GGASASAGLGASVFVPSTIVQVVACQARENSACSPCSLGSAFAGSATVTVNVRDWPGPGPGPRSSAVGAVLTYWAKMPNQSSWGKLGLHAPGAPSGYQQYEVGLVSWIES